MGAISLLSTEVLLLNRGVRIPFCVFDLTLQKSPVGNDQEKESSYADAFRARDQFFCHSRFLPCGSCSRPFQGYGRRSRSYMSQGLLVFGPFEARVLREGPMSFAG